MPQWYPYININNIQWLCYRSWSRWKIGFKFALMVLNVQHIQLVIPMKTERSKYSGCVHVFTYDLFVVVCIKCTLHAPQYDNCYHHKTKHENMNRKWLYIIVQIKYIHSYHIFYAQKITKPGETRQAVFIDSLIHAREWLAGATVLRILERVCYLV